MSRKYGFLTTWQRVYLEKKRKNYDSKRKAIEDFHIRKTTYQTLKDLALVISMLERKQFDKIFESKEAKENLEEFLVHLFKRYSEPKYPWGRIKHGSVETIKHDNVEQEYRPYLRAYVYMATDYKNPILTLLQNAVQKAWGNEWLISVTTKEYEEIILGLWKKLERPQPF